MRLITSSATPQSSRFSLAGCLATPADRTTSKITLYGKHPDYLIRPVSSEVRMLSFGYEKFTGNPKNVKW